MLTLDPLWNIWGTLYNHRSRLLFGFLDYCAKSILKKINDAKVVDSVIHVYIWLVTYENSVIMNSVVNYE